MRRVSRGVLLAPLVGVVAAGAALLLDGETGLFPLLGLAEQVSRAERREEQIDAERQQLIGEIRALRSDPLALEAVAREKLGMVRPDEVVIRWTTDVSGSD